MKISWLLIGKAVLIAIVCLITYMFSYWYFLDTNPFMKQSFLLAPLQIFIAFFAIILVIGKLFDSLPFTFNWRFLSVFFYFFLLTGGIWTSTHLIFRTEVNFGGMLNITILISFVTALLVSILFTGEREPKPIIYEVKKYLQERAMLDWLLRGISALFLSFITFYLMHELIFPFLEPYYNPRSSSFLIEGSYVVNTNAMLFHSLLIIIILIPLFALWNGTKSSLLFWVGFPIFLIVAVLPFAMYSSWPLGFRFPILIEMTLILYLQSMILVHLFYVSSNPKEEQQGKLHPFWKYKEFY